MTTIINGSSPSITFSDSTTQASAGLTAANPTITSGVLTFPNASTQSAAGLVVGSASPITSGTSVATTSGTSIDFTGIPSWVKRITVMLNQVGTGGGSNYIMQLGYGSTTIVTSGYTNIQTTLISGVSLNSGYTNGMNLTNPPVNGKCSGHVFITNQTGNTWVFTASIGETSSGRVTFDQGVVSLGGTLSAVRLTTYGGTDTFNSGSYNIFYE